MTNYIIAKMLRKFLSFGIHQYDFNSRCCWNIHIKRFHCSSYKLTKENGSSKSNAKETSLKKTVSNYGIKGMSSLISTFWKKKAKFFTFLFSKITNFLDRYQKLLEQKFPGTMNVYRVFVVGFKDFSIDTKEYLIIANRVIFKMAKVTDLNLKEVDLYYRMPSEMFRVGPTLLISALPFANYVVFPIAYYFPRTLLSSHFWSLQQKSEFAVAAHKKKLVQYRPLFRNLQKCVVEIRDDDLRIKVQNVLFDIGSGIHPSLHTILEIRRVFEKERYSLAAIHGPHASNLCRIHGLGSYLFKRSRLYNRAEMLRSIDQIIIKEGLHNLKSEELKVACFLRGLNSSNLQHDEMITYLKNWLHISESTHSSENSLLLHLPILLSYNHPNNWMLLKS